MATSETSETAASSPWSVLANPIVLIALLIVVSVIALIGAAVVDWDKGKVLTSMAQQNYARGLITYLFAVVTIGTAVVLVLAALLSHGDDVSEKRFQHGKEILSLLLGVFGTMVGFYFGAETASAPKGETAIVRVSPISVSPEMARVGDRLTLRAVVTGGAAPYRFGVTVGKDEPKPEEPVPTSGWIVKEIAVPGTAKPGELLTVRLVVADASQRKFEQTAQVPVVP